MWTSSSYSHFIEKKLILSKKSKEWPFSISYIFFFPSHLSRCISPVFLSFWLSLMPQTFCCETPFLWVFHRVVSALISPLFLDLEHTYNGVRASSKVSSFTNMLLSYCRRHGFSLVCHITVIIKNKTCHKKIMDILILIMFKIDWEIV